MSATINLAAGGAKRLIYTGSGGYSSETYAAAELSGAFELKIQRWMSVFDPSAVTVDRMVCISPDVSQCSLDGWGVVSLSVTLTLSSADYPVKAAVLTSQYQNGSAFELFMMCRDLPIHSLLSGGTSHTLSFTGSDAQNVLRYGLVLSATHSDDFSVALTSFAAALTYVDGEAPPVARALSPRSETLLSISSITFSWSYSQDAGNPQTAYYVEVSADGGTTWTTVASGTGSATSATVAGGTLSDGAVCWRVRVSSGELVGVSDIAYIAVRTNPATSSVTCDGKPRPTVSWTASGQTAFQVRFGEFDSGAVFGSDLSYTLPLYFDDGVYPASVRTQTGAGAWSDWTDEIYVSVANSAPSGTVVLDAVQEGFDARLRWFADGTFSYYVVYRDGRAIAKTTSDTYVDSFAAGQPEYFVRAVASNGYYVRSNAARVTFRLRCDGIRDVSVGAVWLPLKYSPSPPSRSYDRAAEVSYRYFAGRTKPVSVTEGFTRCTGRFSAAFRTRDEAEKLIALTGRTVVRKDTSGGLIIGVLNDVGCDSEKILTLTYSVTETDHIEEAVL